MAKYNSLNPISLSLQACALKTTFKDLIEKYDIKSGTLSCVMRITLSENSDTYRVLIKYKISSRRGETFPQVWLIDPQIKTKNGKLPKHLYLSKTDSMGHVCLCLFYPGYKEWNRNMLIANTFVPWISAWLNTYEYWLITGEWQYAESPHGGSK